MYDQENGDARYRNDSGLWWMVSCFSATNSHNMNTHLGFVGPKVSTRRGNGFAIRCVTREG